MANMWGRSGAPMIQPTKDEIRQWLAEAREDAEEQRRLRRLAESQLEIAKRKLGMLFLEGKIDIPLEQIGELVLAQPDQPRVEVEETAPTPQRLSWRR